MPRKETKRTIVIISGLVAVVALIVVFNWVTGNQDDRSWASEKLTIPLSNDQFHLHIRMNPKLDAESRRVLIDSQVLREGLEELISYAARSPLEFRHVDTQGNSVLFAGSSPSIEPFTIPDIVPPHCCMHRFSSYFKGEFGEGKSDPNFHLHTCQQAKNQESISSSKKFLLFPVWPTIFRGQSRSSFLESLSIKDTNHRGNFDGPKPIAIEPALIRFGSGAGSQEKGAISENIDRVQLRTFERGPSPFQPNGEIETLVSLDVFLDDDTDKIFKNWTKDHVGEQLVVMSNGWILSQTPLLSSLEIVEKISFTRAGGPGSFQIVSMLYSMGFISIEVIQ